MEANATITRLSSEVSKVEAAAVARNNEEVRCREWPVPEDMLTYLTSFRDAQTIPSSGGYC